MKQRIQRRCHRYHVVVFPALSLYLIWIKSNHLMFSCCPVHRSQEDFFASVVEKKKRLDFELRVVEMATLLNYFAKKGNGMPFNINSWTGTCYTASFSLVSCSEWTSLRATKVSLSSCSSLTAFGLSAIIGDGFQKTKKFVFNSRSAIIADVVIVQEIYKVAR